MSGTKNSPDKYTIQVTRPGFYSCCTVFSGGPGEGPASTSFDAYIKVLYVHLFIYTVLYIHVGTGLLVVGDGQPGSLTLDTAKQGTSVCCMCQPVNSYIVGINWCEQMLGLRL